MWPFKKKQEPVIEENNKLEEHKKKYPIGMEFVYMGIVMRIYQNVNWDFDFEDYPVIYCNYVNKHGEIKTIHFCQDELEVLEVIQ